MKQKWFIFIDTLQGHWHHPILIEPVRFYILYKNRNKKVERWRGSFFSLSLFSLCDKHKVIGTWIVQLKKRSARLDLINTNKQKWYLWWCLVISYWNQIIFVQYISGQIKLWIYELKKFWGWRVINEMMLNKRLRRTVQ